MSEGDYFVMLNCQRVGITPMVNEHWEVAMFESFEEAKEAAKDTLLGEAFGFEVFCRGCGEF